MYHVYEIATQNEGIDWHVYAEYQEEVRTMITNLNGFMLQECRDLAKAINYQSIASKLKSGTGCGREKQEIKSFFARFHRPLIKQHGVIGGYALDYRKCSVRENVEMPYSVMLSYLDMALYDEFFILEGIEPVYAGGNENKHRKL